VNQSKRDVAGLLGATGPGAWALAGLYCITYAIISVWAGGEYARSLLGVFGYLLMVGSAIALVHPRLSPLPWPVAAGIVVATQFTVATGLWQLEADTWYGWVTWYVGATSYLMFILALRGHFAWAAFGMVLESAIAMFWMWSLTGDALRGLDLTYQQLALFGAGGFFAVWLRRTAGRIAAFQETRLRRAAAEGARAAIDEERTREVDAVSGLAGRALEEIARGGDRTADDRRADGFIEAQLRDRIRGRALAHEPLVSEVHAARRRGVLVALLDDVRGDLEVSALAPAIDAAARVVATATSESVTVRLRTENGKPIVTVATADDEVATFSPTDLARAAPGLHA
jgi:hypothetical protein